MAGVASTYHVETDTYHISRAEEAIRHTIETMQTAGALQNKRAKQNETTRLRRIAKHANIFNPLEVKTFISKLTGCNGTKNNYETLYVNFCEANQLPPYDLTHYKYKSPIPLIPTTENINIILNALNQKFYTPIKIMSETAVEGEELHKTKRNMIDPQTGNISIVGSKGHDNGTYKLQDETAEALRQYMAKYKNEQPFPESRLIGNAWRAARNTRAKELSKPELLKIPLKNLRNYAGAIFYLTKGKDPIQTMHFMRHLKIETTIDYLRGIQAFTAKARYITKTVKLGTETTVQQITDLSNAGFEHYDNADGYKFYRILQV